MPASGINSIDKRSRYSDRLRPSTVAFTRVISRKYLRDRCFFLSFSPDKLSPSAEPSKRTFSTVGDRDRAPISRLKPWRVTLLPELPVATELPNLNPTDRAFEKDLLDY